MEKNAELKKLRLKEALKYIEILKDLNKTFAQRVEELEINCEKLLQELEILD